MARSIVLTAERLRELLAYDEATGFLIWANPQSNQVEVGQRAGTIASNGRRYISIDNEKHMAHRLVWFHVNGVWPIGNVVPENGNYDDTRIENLREETPGQTASKGRPRASNKSGVKGVSWDSKRSKWVASITRDYHQVNLGRYETLEDAANAVKAAQESPVEVSAEARAAAAKATMRRGRQRRLWETTLEASNGTTGWNDFDEFCRDVGEVARTAHKLVPIDISLPIGPGNFQWMSACGFNLQTAEGRRARERKIRADDPLKFRELYT